MSLDNLFPAISQTSFTDAEAAVTQLMMLYDDSVASLARHFGHYRIGGDMEGRVHAYYPYLALHVEQEAQHLDPRQSFGFCHSTGYFGTTITRPDLFRNYLTEQIATLLEVHGGSVEVGVSRQPIPVHFALQKELSEYSREMGAGRVYAMRHYFDMPDLANIDDVISDGAYHAQANECEKHVPGRRRCTPFM